MAEPASSSLLPTPAVNDMGAGKTVQAWDDWTGRMQAKHGNGNGHGKSLSIETLRLLPTPVADHSRGLPSPTTDYASLPNVVVGLLPTPKTTDAHHASPADSNRNSPGLRAITALLPTPTSSDAAGSRNSTHKRPPGSTANIGDTLTDAVTVLIGDRTRQPSTAGKPSPDDPHPSQLSLVATDHASAHASSSS
jgi:hypothetical protein